MSYSERDSQPTRGINGSKTAGLLLASLLLLAVGFAFGRLSSDSQTPGVQADSTLVSPTPIPTADFSLPTIDVPGDDIADLPRFDGSRRVEYRQVVFEGLLETEAEYVMLSDLESVHDFYRDVFDRLGWVVADLGVHQGEWTFLVIQGAREALVEIESRGPLIEVEIELTEPYEFPNPLPTRVDDATAQPVATVQPLATPQSDVGPGDGDDDSGGDDGGSDDDSGGDDGGGDDGGDDSDDNGDDGDDDGDEDD